MQFKNIEFKILKIPTENVGFIPILRTIKKGVPLEKRATPWCPAKLSIEDHRLRRATIADAKAANPSINEEGSGTVV